MKQINILLVEDNPYDADLVMRSFKKSDIKNIITWLKDGEEALSYIFSNLHTSMLILLDLKLPKVDGLEVLKILKSDQRTSSIPIIVLTSSQEECDIIEANKHYANSYIVKPVNYSKFSETMERVGTYWLNLNKT
jgi:two-component system response regulator